MANRATFSARTNGCAVGNPSLAATADVKWAPAGSDQGVALGGGFDPLPS
ncbi:hypothetical protein H6F76_09885 [Leptolyngbya sp. FACHB-321]|nr:hypothetical protein [Leptolyngbya sp. FACHB-321]MBD2035332.1 hypothetical protein [Leptolyngbya sp. FACHB-321]